MKITGVSLMAVLFCLSAGCQYFSKGDAACTECTAPAAKKTAESDGWITIFNGKDLSGWKVAENPGTFKVQDGVLVVDGPRAHLFYVGADGKASFKNFEWKTEIMTKPEANSGMYFHTQFQESGWPAKGYEVQVNNTHKDPKKTGGIYAVKDVMDQSSVKDGEWFTQHIIVQGKRIIVKVNGVVTSDYTEPDHVQAERPDNMKGRVLGSGTVAIQGHDPKSVIHYRNIQIKPLAD